MPGIPKDHYVPQFYLKGFAIKKNEKEPHIWVYTNEKIFPSKIGDIAGEKHFYTFTEKDTGKANREIDDFFTKVETLAAPILKKIIREEIINITNDQLENLAIFFAVLAVRTPGAVKGQESLRAEVMKEFLALETTNPEVLRKKYKDMGVILTDEQWMEQLKFMREKKYSIKFGESSRIFFVAQGLQVAGEIAAWYHQAKHWHLLVNNTSTVFITSDHPISIFKPVYVPKAMNVGYGNGTILITISPKLAILLRDIPLKSRTMYLSEKKVIEINKNIMKFSNNYIFSNLKSKKIHNTYKIIGNKHFQKTKTSHAKHAPYIFFQTNSVPEELLQ